MKLFGKVNSKYYEAMHRWLTSKDKERKNWKEYEEEFRNLSEGDIWSIRKMLFPQTENEKRLLFQRMGELYYKNIEDFIPVRCTAIEKHALKSLTELPEARMLLSDALLDKLKKVTEEVPYLWETQDIISTNRYRPQEKERETLLMLLEAIRNNQMILEKNGTAWYPVTLEYSCQYNEYHVWGYLKDQDIFERKSLTEIHGKVCDRENSEDLYKKFQNYMKEHKEDVQIRVESLFGEMFYRFSGYEHEITYDEKEKRYYIKISYYPFEEEELIEDILSFGESALVLTRGTLQQEIYCRVKRALEELDEK